MSHSTRTFILLRKFVLVSLLCLLLLVPIGTFTLLHLNSVSVNASPSSVDIIYLYVNTTDIATSSRKQNTRSTNDLRFTINKALSVSGISFTQTQWEYVNDPALNTSYLDSFDLIVIGSPDILSAYAPSVDSCLIVTITPILADYRGGAGYNVAFDPMFGLIKDASHDGTAVSTPVNISFTDKAPEILKGHTVNVGATATYIANLTVSASASIICWGNTTLGDFPLLVYNGSKNYIVNSWAYMDNYDPPSTNTGSNPLRWHRNLIYLVALNMMLDVFKQPETMTLTFCMDDYSSYDNATNNQLVKDFVDVNKVPFVLLEIPPNEIVDNGDTGLLVSPYIELVVHPNFQDVKDNYTKCVERVTSTTTGYARYKDIHNAYVSTAVVNGHYGNENVTKAVGVEYPNSMILGSSLFIPDNYQLFQLEFGGNILYVDGMYLTTRMYGAVGGSDVETLKSNLCLLKYLGIPYFHVYGHSHPSELSIMQSFLTWAKANINIRVVSYNAFLFNYRLNLFDSIYFVNAKYDQITKKTLSEYSFTFISSAPSGTTSTTKVYCGDKGRPQDVEGASSWSYDDGTNIITINVVHSSSKKVIIHWAAISSSLVELKSRLNSYLLIFYLIPVVLAVFGVQQTLQNGFDPQLFKVVLGAIVSTIIVAYIVNGIYTTI